ncbi:HlyD family secretion protein [Pedobacter suwonensis]|uniref:HlyD family secretion protein n=1 Tax=Pedobacter suwonensis TaxID=332999 RepID=A0A1I0T9T1_9SPHI|nr:HlyD family efflux transporter periplasmic adaptor subunit [Pedobacter suwonensis]SFA48501.1 HlyD family secretion protein [Pedobacter suwonensis]
MNTVKESLDSNQINCEEVQEIITSVPSWILKWGISLVFLVLVSIVTASSFIQYPDIIKTGMKVNSLNAPKPVYAKQTGKIISLLVAEGAKVSPNTPLAFMESTASYRDVLKLRQSLIIMHDSLTKAGRFVKLTLKDLNLGELQSQYQNFYQQYLQFISTREGGYYQNKKKYLKRDLLEINNLKQQILSQQALQTMELKNIQDEFDAYKKLREKGVISKNEYRQQENKYLSGNYPLQQTSTAILTNRSVYLSKQKEILELKHTIEDENAKFMQSLGKIISDIDIWVNQYVLKAPVYGSVTYAGIIQENQTVMANQEVFMIKPDNTNFFGEIRIPQYNMGKVSLGQRALIKVHGYPFEQFGVIRGKISYISDVAVHDSVFIAKVDFEQFEHKDPELSITLKNGMLADAEIVTKESSWLSRILRNLKIIVNNP